MELAEYAIGLIEPNDGAMVQSVFESDHGYCEINQGTPASETQSLFTDLPEVRIVATSSPTRFSIAMAGLW